MTERKPTVLVVDDKANMLSLMTKVLRHDARVITATSGADGLARVAAEPVSVVLSDLRMPDMSGMELLLACKRIRPSAEFILMTAYASVGTAVEALRAGAYDYLTKPFDPADARGVILSALGRERATTSAASPDRVSGPADPEDGATEVLPGTVARSQAMKALGDLVHRVANSAATTLILGETGTGKERIARAIHRLSPRAAHRFVAVNCAAIPADLLESELFGFVRGAFTGATRERAGLFEEAHRGTLFLDEIGELRPSLQAKLTRALEERAVRRIGDSRERAVDTRIVAATHRDLEAMVANDAFREDLWYRLNVAVIEVPPLRDRPGDIGLLVHEFLRELAPSLPGRRIRGFSAEAARALEQHSWPGNVRQLRAAVERACVVAEGDEVRLDDLPRELRATRPAEPASTDWLRLGETAGGEPQAAWTGLGWADAMRMGRKRLGRAYLEAVLRAAGGHVTEAASRAGVERESFYRLLRRHGIDAARFRGGSRG